MVFSNYFANIASGVKPASSAAIGSCRKKETDETEKRHFDSREKKNSSAPKRPDSDSKNKKAKHSSQGGRHDDTHKQDSTPLELDTKKIGKKQCAHEKKDFVTSPNQEPGDTRSNFSSKREGSREKDHQNEDHRKRRRGRSESQNERVSKVQRKCAPSQEALNLSQVLKDLSKRKQLDEALNVYWSKANDKFRDAHHACIIIDCCARCGNVSRAEEVIEGIPAENITIELQTALIKGYAHAGDMHNAMRVFVALFPSRQSSPVAHKRKQQLPNVRTLNTVLRGCQWTAAMSRPSTGMLEEGNSVAGGVISSEQAWKLYLEHCGNDSPPDSSSYETTVAILCQALRIKEAQERIEHFQEQFDIRVKGKATIKTENPDQSILETLGAAYLSLARAHAILGNWEEVWIASQRSLHSIQYSRDFLTENSKKDEPEVPGKSKTKHEAVRGGKRAWKKGDSEQDGDLAERRDASNRAYREHRLNEMEMEIKSLLKRRGIRGNIYPTRAATLEILLTYISSRLFYFGGGGSTELSEQRRSSNIIGNVSNETRLFPNWASFGLHEVYKATGRHFSNDVMDLPESVLKAKQDCLDSRGRLLYQSIFGGSPKPIDVEIGAGFGDWVVEQAEQRPERNHIAVELRSDRVHRIFSKMLLNQVKPVENVCVVGAEAGDFLRNKIAFSSVSTLFVNHPEPPTQMFGDDHVDLDKVQSGEAEPAHILSFVTLKAAFNCLRPGGQIVVVTDNKWYARLLCVTTVRLSNEVNSLMGTVNPSHLAKHGFRQVEKFSSKVQYFEGQPNEAIGHAVQQSSRGNSYFDRLWRTGVSTYAQKTSRFIVIIRRKD